ncbi:MAG: hypothetical protein MSH52_07635 [Christensenellaceae bacterium]|nr:hypothetical protein [Christensenellaceae bacterium]
MLCGNAARIRLGVSMLGFIRLKIRPMESNKKHAAKDSKVKPDKDTIKIALAVLRQRKRYLWLDGLTIRGSIGIDGDAAATALLCGAANSLLPRVIRFLLPNKGAESIYIAPEFGFGSAWVYMEGIIGLNLAKLIGIIGKEVTRYVASRGKHNAEYNGTIKANG